jgi:hypothetical protein
MITNSHFTFRSFVSGHKAYILYSCAVFVAGRNYPRPLARADTVKIDSVNSRPYTSAVNAQILI